MSTLTAKYGWVKPTVGGDPTTWGTEINGDLDAIDAVMNATRPGLGGTASGHTYNIDWNGSGAANLWIDSSNEGVIITSTGGTINGSFTVNGTIFCADVQVVGNGNLGYQCFNSAGQVGAFYWEAATNIIRMSNFTGSGGSISIDPGGNCQLPGDVTSARGWIGRAGINGPVSNPFNINWKAGAAELWIDDGYEGNIITSAGGTISGSLGVTGSVVSSAAVQGAYVYSTGDVHADGAVTANGNVTCVSFGANNDITASNGAYYGSDSSGALLNCVGGGSFMSFRWASPWGYFRINSGLAEMVIATGNARNLSYAAGGGPLNQSLNGNAANGTFYGIICDAVCDERIKQNIRPTSVDALKIVNAIPVDEFEIKAPVAGWMATVNEPDRDARARTMSAAKPRHVPIGLVAQKLQALIPDAVYTSPDDRPPEDSPLPPNVLTLADAQLTPYLLRAIQQLTERVQMLEARLAA